MGWGTQTVLLLAETPTADETRSTGCLWRERALGRPPGQGAPRGQERRASSAQKRLESDGKEGAWDLREGSLAEQHRREGKGNQ